VEVEVGLLVGEVVCVLEWLVLGVVRVEGEEEWEGERETVEEAEKLPLTVEVEEGEGAEEKVVLKVCVGLNVEEPVAEGVGWGGVSEGVALREKEPVKEGMGEVVREMVEEGHRVGEGEGQGEGDMVSEREREEAEGGEDVAVMQGEEE